MVLEVGMGLHLGIIIRRGHEGASGDWQCSVSLLRCCYLGHTSGKFSKLFYIYRVCSFLYTVYEYVYFNKTLFFLKFWFES